MILKYGENRTGQGEASEAAFRKANNAGFSVVSAA